MVRKGQRLVAGRVEIIALPGRTDMGDKSIVMSDTIIAGGSGTKMFQMSEEEVTKMLVRGIAAEMEDTGDAASYLAVRYNDGITMCDIKRTTAAAPKVEWSGNWIDRGRDLAGFLVGRIQLDYYNAGAASKTCKVVFNIEKVA